MLLTIDAYQLRFKGVYSWFLSDNLKHRTPYHHANTFRHDDMAPKRERGSRTISKERY